MPSVKRPARKTSSASKARGAVRGAPASRGRAGSKAQPRRTDRKAASSRPSATRTTTRTTTRTAAKKTAAKGKTSPKSIAKTAKRAAPVKPVKSTSSPKSHSKPAAKARAHATPPPIKATMSHATKTARRSAPARSTRRGTPEPYDPNALIHGIRPYLAKAGETYMSSQQLDHFRQILRAWKRELMEEVDRTVHHMQDEASNFPDPNDRATQESEFGLELRTRDRERKLLKKIDSALERIEEGTYGYCEETGEEIGLKRLEARPVATLSLEAQERRELAEKQYGERDDRYR